MSDIDELITLRRELKKSDKRIRVSKAKGKNALIRFFRILSTLAGFTPIKLAPVVRTGHKNSTSFRARVRRIREITGLSLPIAAQAVKFAKKGVLYYYSSVFDKVSPGSVKEQLCESVLDIPSGCDCCGSLGTEIVGPKGRMDLAAI